MYLCPIGVLNDGLIELCYYTKNVGFLDLVRIMDLAKKDYGTQICLTGHAICRG
jgi:hypothetical protein